MTAMSLPSVSRATLRRFIPLGCLAVVSCVAAVSVWWGVRDPAAARLELAETSYRSAKQSQDQLHRTRALQEQAQRAQRDVEGVWNALPTHNEFSSFAMAISEMARLEHVVIPGMGYHVGKSEGLLPVKAILTFKVTGQYGAIYRFIHRLETTEPYLVIESLDAARVDKSDRASSMLVVFNVKIMTFLRPEPAQGKES
jgi:hypothetical protein